MANIKVVDDIDCVMLNVFYGNSCIFITIRNVDAQVKTRPGAGNVAITTTVFIIEHDGFIYRERRCSRRNVEDQYQEHGRCSSSG